MAYARNDGSERIEALDKASTEEQMADVRRLLREQTRLLEIMALGSLLAPTGGDKVEQGTLVGGTGTYRELYRNQEKRPMAVQVQGVFSANQGRLRLSRGASAARLADELSAQGKSISSPIVLTPGEALYIANADPAGYTFVAADSFRCRLFSITALV